MSFQVDLLKQAMLQTDFQGLTGRVHFDKVTGDRIGTFHLVNYQPSGAKKIVATEIEASSARRKRSQSALTRTLTQTDAIVYTGSQTEFSSTVQYTLEWVTNTDSYTSTDKGDTLSPTPIVKVPPPPKAFARVGNEGREAGAAGAKWRVHT